MYKHSIQQILVGSDSVANGDFILSLDQKIADVQVECHIDSGFNTLVGWNSAAGNDKILPGGAKSYGIEGGLLAGKLAVNFEEGGSGAKKAVITIWTQSEEVC